MVFSLGYIVVGNSPIVTAVSSSGTNWNTYHSILSNSINHAYGVASDTSKNIVMTGLAGSNHPNVIVSTNGGLTWSATNLNDVFKKQGYGVLRVSRYINSTGNIYVAYGHDTPSGGGPHLCYGSPSNLTNWQQQTVSFFGNQGYIKSMATDGSGTFLCVGYNGNAGGSIGNQHIAYSTNYGSTWNNVTAPIFTGTGNGIAYGLIDTSSCYVAVGTNTTGNPTVYACEYNDPTTWSAKGNPFNHTGTILAKLAYTDPLTSTQVEVTTDGYGTCVATDGNGLWVVGGKSSTGTNNTYYTYDFNTYTLISGGPSVEVYSIYYNLNGNGTTEPYWYVLGDSGAGNPSIYYSMTSPPTTLTSASGTQPAISNSISYGQFDVSCFAKGTRISTPIGYIPVEDLHEGDVILINKGEYANIRKIFHCTVKVTSETAPYRIPGGEGHEDLTISPTHSVFVHGQMIEAQFLGYPYDDRYTDLIEYYNISVDGDENTVMYANGVPIETYRERNSI